MDQVRLLKAMLKLALDTNQVRPDEVMAVLQDKKLGKPEDKSSESIDNDVIDAESPDNSDVQNIEGKILEQSFKEFEVQEAIEVVKEKKQLKLPITTQTKPEDNNPTQNNNYVVQKTANFWEVLKSRVKP